MSHLTFRGRTLEEARRAAEQALGPGFVVLATRKTQKSALFGLFSTPEFEITAAAPDKPAPAHKPHVFADIARMPVRTDRDETDAIRSEVRNEVRTLRALFARNVADERSSMEPLAREIEAELGELHDILLDMQADRGREAPAHVKRVLTAAGIEGNYARLVARKVQERGDDESVVESFKAVVCDLVRTTAFPLSRGGKKQIALVGPTGVGKTTTAAKLAAHAILEQKRTVKLISCDSYRVGAVEQLERFATLLGAEFCSVKTRHGLEEELLSTNADIVIIDTAGRPSERDDIESALPRLGNRKGPNERETLLCLPAALREVDARRLARLFAPCQPTSLVVTKLDETAAPSGLLHGPLATKLPIAALCFGQRVPEDIAPAHPKAILDALCPAPRKSQAFRSAAS